MSQNTEEKHKKPKCQGCGKAGEDNIYYWQQVIDEGYWWHFGCYKKIADEIDRIVNASMLKQEDKPS